MDNKTPLGTSIVIPGKIKCEFCGSAMHNNVDQNCGSCNKSICQNCSFLCDNDKAMHLKNFFCKNCYSITCTLCELKSFCNLCMTKCFCKTCNNIFCSSCIKKNCHQIRTDTVNCKFYSCDSCKTNNNCILTTYFCGFCDKRVCKACYMSNHKAHNIVK